jgi:hypothetical protein
MKRLFFNRSRISHCWLKEVHPLFPALILTILICANFITKTGFFDFVHSAKFDGIKLYFFHGLHDPVLFASDPMVAALRTQGRLLCPTGLFILLYVFFMNFFPLWFIAKLFSISIAFATTLVIYRTGLFLRSRELAFLYSFIFLIYFLTTGSFYGGHMRTFGCFIFTIFVFYYLKGSFAAFPFLIILGVLFYPALFPLFFIATLFFIFFYKKSWRNKKEAFTYLLRLGSACAISVALVKNSFAINLYRENLAVSQAYKLTQSLYGTKPGTFFYLLTHGIFNCNEHGKLYGYVTIFLLASCLALLFLNKKGNRAFPKRLLLLLASGFLAFLILVPFDFVSASRQLVFIVPLILVTFVSVHMDMLLSGKKWKLVFITSALAIFLIFSRPMGPLINFGIYAPIYKILSVMPTDSLIAGHPESQLIASIPFFAKRPVFYSDKLEVYKKIFYGNACLADKKRKKMLLLYFSPKTYVFKTTLLENRINYIILEEKYFDRMIRYKPNNSFYLLNIAKKQYLAKFLVEGRHIFIVDARDVLKDFST